ncbi:MAG: 16S rRNA (uracil(1498)-N(3))-methyltransferase [Clostridia bacterium]|nr:16S rRNA (uracil(1498)-N(3))-methyltransferase [Clostridia bacterium]
MHRFFIARTDRNSNRAELSKEDKQHALRVLRLRDGEAVQALDGEGGVWEGTLRVDGDDAYIEVGQALDSKEANVFVTLYMGIPKGEKLDFIVQKLTELGAKRLVPVKMDRCIAKIEEKEQEKKLARLKKISMEAQKQCGRAGEMEILPPVSVSKLSGIIEKHDLTMLLWEEAEGFRIRDAYKERESTKDIAYIVGPEGGISEKEADILIASGAKCVTLGPRILRAETAAVAGAAVIMSLWGDI